MGTVPQCAQRLRCAIYTRKSSEEGLEQSFNSLDAQREACTAYVASQTHEGWSLAPEHYDDGGYSGGSMERPGLKQLLKDVEDGHIDIIIVYKVDRLSRSLSDFARMVEIMDRAKVSFVSVTQAFNTTTSMGRLTLNMLLSFAQFEREVTGERIRDKIAASKKKGMWMGGTVPLGYEVQNRNLVVNPEEARTVRHIMERYLALSSVRELKRELDEQGIVTKQTLLRSGSVRGGIAFGLGGLRTLLKNRIYIGEIKHRDCHYAGLHEAIIEPQLFERVQQAMADMTTRHTQGMRAAEPSLLSGLVRDPLGRPIYASHSVKNGKRYRYYVTHPSHVPSGGPKPWRVAAHPLERAVLDELRYVLGSQAAIAQALNTAPAGEMAAAIEDASQDAKLLAGPLSGALRPLLLKRIASLTLDTRHLDIAIRISDVVQTGRRVSIAKIRSGTDVRLQVLPDSTAHNAPRNEELVALIAEAYAARKAMLASPSQPIESIARQQQTGYARFKQLIRLSYLAPDIVQAIFTGTQPAELTLSSLKTAKAIPINWAAQKAMFGFS